MLSPRYSFSEIFPKGSLLAIREWNDLNPFLPTGGVVRDGLTGGQLPVLGQQRTCVHKALLGPVAMRLYEAAGIELSPNIVSFTTLDELREIVARTIARGEHVVLQYPPDPETVAALAGKAGMGSAISNSDFYVPPDVLALLNDKAALEKIVGGGARLPRFYVAIADLDPNTPPAIPVVMKAATRSGTGAGLDVRLCRDRQAWSTAVAWFRSRSSFLHGVIVERFDRFQRSWCANFAILPDGKNWIALGASEQLIVDGYLYAGNVNGEGHQPPDGTPALIEAIAVECMKEGFRGIGGFDFAVAEDGRLVCFDLNLRINGCTTQLLLHDSACARIGGTVTRTLRLTIEDPDVMVTVVGELIEAGHLVPISFLDARLHAAGPPASILTCLLVASRHDDLTALALRLQATLSPKSD